MAQVAAAIPIFYNMNDTLTGEKKQTSFTLSELVSSVYSNISSWDIDNNYFKPILMLITLISEMVNASLGSVISFC